jgi:hypothetical protein
LPASINPYEKRRRAIEARLRDALERLVQGRPAHAAHQNGYRLTIAALAREAGIGRNAIYTNHRAILDLLAAAAAGSSAPPTTWQDKIDELHGIIRTMKQAERRQITHNAQLLARARAAEAEADRHRRHNARLIAQRDTALRAVSLDPQRTKDSRA